MQLLHLDSSALGAASVSRQLSAEIVARQRALHPDIRVAYRDLAADPALHLTGAHMAIRAGAPNEDATIDADLVKGNAYLDDLLAADIVVIGAPMYNFSIPTPLKSWVDRIAVAGKTFRRTARILRVEQTEIPMVLHRGLVEWLQAPNTSQTLGSMMKPQ